jgi:hypothetical protein
MRKAIIAIVAMWIAIIGMIVFMPKSDTRIAPKTKQPCPPSCGQIEPLYVGQPLPSFPKGGRSPAAKPVPVPTGVRFARQNMDRLR